MHQILFDRYCFKKGETIPEHLKLEGSFAITRDIKHVGWLHKLFFIVQKIHNFFLRRKDDANMCHAMVILKKDSHKKDHLILAHGVLDGIHTSSRNYIAQNKPESKDVTELVIYIPKSEALRELLAKNAMQTAFTPEKFLNGVRSNHQKPKFCYSDLAFAFFQKRRSKKPSKRNMQRLALLTADLLLGNQILNRKGKIRNLFCLPYALLLLQASILMENMNKAEFLKLQNRKTIAKSIFQQIQKKDSTLGKTYWHHRICQINARFETPAYTKSILDSSCNFKTLPF